MNFAEKIDFLCKHFGGIGELGKIIGVSTQAIRVVSREALGFSAQAK